MLAPTMSPFHRTCGVVLIFGLGALGASLTACSEGKAPAKGKKRGPPPAIVRVAKAQGGTFTDGWRFLGQVKPALSAKLASATAGHVKTVRVREGDVVKKNQILATLDANRVSADVSAARAKEQQYVAELAQAKRQLARIEKLAYPTVTEPEKEKYRLDVLTLDAKLKAQRADTRRVQVDYGHHIVRAPFAGVIAARHVDPGAWVKIGEPVLDVVSVENIEVHTNVSMALGGRVKKGDTAVLVGRTRVPATIAGVVPALDATTRTMRIRLVPKGKAPWLLPGAALDVEFTVTFDGEGVTVPRDALVRGPTNVKLIRVVDGKAVPTNVKVIATAAKQALVTAPGLAAGDTIIVRGNERLRPGQPIKIMPTSGAKPAPRGRPRH